MWPSIRSVLAPDISPVRIVPPSETVSSFSFRTEPLCVIAAASTMSSCEVLTVRALILLSSPPQAPLLDVAYFERLPQDRVAAIDSLRHGERYEPCSGCPERADY